MRCSGCGRELSGKMKFCKYCGTPLDSQEMDAANTINKCRSCGTPLKEGNAFCTHCGSPIIIAEPEPEGKRGKFPIILLGICILLTIGGFIVLYHFRDTLFNGDEGVQKTQEKHTEYDEIASDEGNTSLAATGQNEEKNKAQAEQTTYTIVCQDLYGVTLFTDNKEGYVGTQITVIAPQIDEYTAQSDSQNIELSADSSNNVITFKYRPDHEDKIDGTDGTDGQSADSLTSYNVAGQVSILNKKYAQRDDFSYLAKRFEKESGIEVNVESPKSGDYSKTLEENINGSSKDPTLFMISGQEDLKKYMFECLDLSKTTIVDELQDERYALKDSDGHIYGLGFIVESLGITVNTSLLGKAGYNISEINSFSDLKRIAEDITSRKDELGFSAFTANTVGKNSSGNYRLSQHAAAVPLFYELQDNGFDLEEQLKGTYMAAYKEYVNLCLDNATVTRETAKNQSLDDAQQEFIEGKAVFHQDGFWSYEKLKEGMANYGSGEMAVIPLYMGIPGEEKQALNEACSYYWCVNRYASKDDQEATLQFLQWLVTSEEGCKILAEDMNFLIPYKKAIEPDNIFYIYT